MDRTPRLPGISYLAAMLRLLLLGLPLLLVGPALPSGKETPLTLEQIVRRSDAVLKVERLAPPVRTETVPAGKKPGQAFDFTLHRYRVKAVVHIRLDSLTIPETLEVEEAADADNFAQTRNQVAGKPTKILLYKVYRPSDPPPDSTAELLIFVRYDRKRKRFAFVARDALESVRSEARMRALLAPRR